MNSQEIFEREFLEIRAKILEIAASLDRIQRAEGSLGDDARMSLIKAAIDVVASGQADPCRAEKIQLLFSREYEENWMDKFDLTARH